MDLEMKQKSLTCKNNKQWSVIFRDIMQNKLMFIKTVQMSLPDQIEYKVTDLQKYRAKVTDMKK